MSCHSHSIMFIPPPPPPQISSPPRLGLGEGRKKEGVGCGSIKTRNVITQNYLIFKILQGEKSIHISNYQYIQYKFRLFDNGRVLKY